MTPVIALLGPKALYLLFGWMLSAIIAQDLSDLKGYREKPGLATGLLLSAIAVVVWLVWPPKRGSAWDRRVKPSDLVTACAAVVLILSLFLKWFPGQSYFGRLSSELNGSPIHIYMVLLPLAAAVCYAQMHFRGRAGDRGWIGRATVGAAALALLLTLVQALDKPDGGSLKIGFFVAVVASVVALVGAVLASRQDRTQRGPETAAEARAEDDAAATA